MEDPFGWYRKSLTVDDLAALKLAGRLEKMNLETLNNVGRLQSVASHWLLPNASHNARSEYLASARKILRQIDKLEELLGPGSTTGHSRLVGDISALAKPDPTGTYVWLGDPLAKIRLEIEKLVEAKKVDQNKFVTDVKRLLLALLLEAFYELDGSQQLPTKSFDPATTKNAQFLFVRAFCTIMSQKVKGVKVDLKTDWGNRLLIIDDLARADPGTLRRLMKEAKVIALEIINNMPYGIRIEDGQVTAVPYDERIHGHPEEDFEAALWEAAWPTDTDGEEGQGA